MKRVILLVVAVFFAASGAAAQHYDGIGVFSDASGTDCEIVSTGPVELHVIHFGHDGASASEFMLDVYPPAWVYMGETWDFLSIGDATTGVTLSYGGCMAAPTHLGVVEFFGFGTPCEEIRVGPAPGKTFVEGLDCSGSPVHLPPVSILADCGPCGVESPYDLLPVDGTAGVPLNPTLSWSWDEPTACPEGLGLTIFSVYLGTDPENLAPAGWVDTVKELTVGPLDPSTQYYWQVGVVDSFWECPGDRTAHSTVQRFTTSGPVPVEQTTWGKIKSLFR